MGELESLTTWRAYFLMFSYWRAYKRILLRFAHSLTIMTPYWVSIVTTPSRKEITWSGRVDTNYGVIMGAVGSKAEWLCGPYFSLFLLWPLKERKGVVVALFYPILRVNDRWREREKKGYSHRSIDTRNGMEERSLSIARDYPYVPRTLSFYNPCGVFCRSFRAFSFLRS